MEIIDQKVAALKKILKPIELQVQTHRSKLLSLSTEVSYKKISDRLSKRINFDEMFTLSDAIKDTKSKNTFFLRRAACEHVLLNKIDIEIQNFFDQVHETQTVELSCILTSIESLRDELIALRELRMECHLGARRSRRRSKRSSLTGLPTDWRERVYLKGANGKYALAIAVAAISGCRPRELQMGVLLKIIDRDGGRWLSISINGAKVSNENGQPYRELLYSLSQLAFIPAILAFEVQKSRGSVSVSIASTKAFSMAVARLGKALWPKRHEALTPYSFRHAIASDLKSSKSKVDVAGCLGHASTKTQKNYGQRQQARSTGMLIPDGINVSREIRIIQNSFTENVLQNESVLNIGK